MAAKPSQAKLGPLQSLQLTILAYFFPLVKRLGRQGAGGVRCGIVARRYPCPQATVLGSFRTREAPLG